MLEASDKALARLEELINSPQEGISLKACDSVLDRNSETARNKKVETDLTGRFTIDPVTLMHAALTATELAQIQEKAAPQLPSGVEKDASRNAGHSQQEG
jgi:hypothetical protein